MTRILDPVPPITRGPFIRPGSPRCEIAVQQIEATRRYVRWLVGQTREQDAYRSPTGRDYMPGHIGLPYIAAQIGHMACAQYRLAVETLRGSRPEDDDVISPEFRDQFGFLDGEGTTQRLKKYWRDRPPASWPSFANVIEVFDRVHDLTLREIQTFDDAMLEEPALIPRGSFRTKLEALLWCARHEMYHAGQLGILHALLGNSPFGDPNPGPQSLYRRIASAGLARSRRLLHRVLEP